MALKPELLDKNATLTVAGYTPKETELAEYLTLELAKKLVAGKYNQIKTSLGINNKKTLELLVYNLLIENINLAVITIINGNQALAENEQKINGANQND